jgi:hypothetical protein
MTFVYYYYYYVGTLSPLEAIKEDFKVPFPIEIQNSHIIRSIKS